MLRSNALTRLLAVALGLSVSGLMSLSQSTNAECIDDQLPCQEYYQIGSGCNTINNPPPVGYTDCCQYRLMHCFEGSATFKKRKLYYGEACTNDGDGYKCPSYDVHEIWF